MVLPDTATVKIARFSNTGNVFQVGFLVTPGDFGTSRNMKDITTTVSYPQFTEPLTETQRDAVIELAWDQVEAEVETWVGAKSLDPSGMVFDHKMKKMKARDPKP